MNHTDKYAEMLRLGKEDGLRYFIAQFSSSLRFYAFKIIRNKEASEEIVSESFVKLWNKREKAVSIHSIKSFLYLITRNACYDYLGAQHQKRIVLSEESVLDGEDVGFDILSQITYNELIVLLVKKLKNCLLGKLRYLRCLILTEWIRKRYVKYWIYLLLMSILQNQKR